MAVLLVKAGAYSLNAKHLQKKGNVWYFRRRVPQDVRSAYPDRPVCLFFSLKTADPHVAARAANQHACEQDALWQTVRSGEPVSTPEARSAAMGILEAFGLEIGQSKVYDKYDL